MASVPALAGPADELLRLDAYRGKVVYIDFWASWCGPCKLSFPFMRQMLGAFHRDDFVIVTVNMDHNRQRADAFLSDQNRDGLPVIYDPSGLIAKHFSVTAMPTSLVVDKSGVVRFRNEGFFADRVSAYAAHIWELLSEKH
jgi:thiol-disulfide isomerase/thioredoxin